jgi:hypothetical protein
MSADMSVAPEIALLAQAAALLVPEQSAAGGPCDNAGSAAAPLTLGALARHLRLLAASPERWWGLVRFDPDRSVAVVVPDRPAYDAWLVVLAPGDAGLDCDCEVATMIAGEATEGPAGTPVLRAGVTRVHGQPHWLRGQGAGYSISLHARAHRRAGDRRH